MMIVSVETKAAAVISILPYQVGMLKNERIECRPFAEIFY